MPYPFGETVTRLRGVPVESVYSTDAQVLDFTDADRLDLAGTGVVPVARYANAASSRNAVAEARATVTAAFQLFFDSTPDILPADHVIVRGLEYRVTGTPQHWASPLSSWVPGTVIDVERVVG